MANVNESFYLPPDFPVINENSTEFNCRLQEAIEKDEIYEGCETNWDKILCWPKSEPGKLAVQKCFDMLNGVPYDASREY